MCIVTLKDGTTYNIDTDDAFQARRVVEYKLRNRHDFRSILTAQQIKGVVCDRNSEYYNSSNEYNGVELKCASGWSYRYD